jgi:hypothetical protein
MTPAARTYMRHFGLSMVAYIIVLIIISLLLQHLSDSPWRIPLALAPVVPVGFALWAFLTFLGRMDELQQRIQLQAFAFAALATGMLFFSYGFLETVGFPHIPLLWVLPTMIALWGVSLAFLTRRYG